MHWIVVLKCGYTNTYFIIQDIIKKQMKKTTTLKWIVKGYEKHSKPVMTFDMNSHEKRLRGFKVI